jgi:hypothetical protein
MGGAFKPGRLIELLHEAEEMLAANGENTHVEAIEEALARLEKPSAWVRFPLTTPPAPRRMISRHQYFQLLVIIAAATEQQKILKSLELAACAITGEDDNAGHTTDILWGSRELDEGLEILGVAVEPAEPGS